MKFPKLIGFLFLSFLSLIACVSPQQYEALLQENEILEEENNVLREELQFSSEDHLLEGKLEADVEKLENDLLQLQQRYRALEKNYIDLTAQYNTAMQNNGNSYTHQDVNCQAELTTIRRTLEEQGSEIRITQLKLQEKEMKIKDLERLLRGFQPSN